MTRTCPVPDNNWAGCWNQRESRETLAVRPNKTLARRKSINFPILITSSITTLTNVTASITQSKYHIYWQLLSISSPQELDFVNRPADRAIFRTQTFNHSESGALEIYVFVGTQRKKNIFVFIQPDRNTSTRATYKKVHRPRYNSYYTLHDQKINPVKL